MNQPATIKTSHTQAQNIIYNDWKDGLIVQVISSLKIPNIVWLRLF